MSYSRSHTCILILHMHGLLSPKFHTSPNFIELPASLDAFLTVWIRSERTCSVWLIGRNKSMVFTKNLLLTRIIRFCDNVKAFRKPVLLKKVHFLLSSMSTFLKLKLQLNFTLLYARNISVNVRFSSNHRDPQQIRLFKPRSSNRFSPSPGSIWPPGRRPGWTGWWWRIPQGLGFSPCYKK
jgi:hypothetical protein